MANSNSNSNSNSSSSSSSENAIIDEELSLSPHASIALSEADTLYYDKRNRLELQETFNENFTLYLPFIIRQMRVESQRLNAMMEQGFGTGTGTENGSSSSVNTDDPLHSEDSTSNSAQQRYTANPIFDLDDLDDDLPTIIDESITLDPQVATNLILNKSTSKFNLKREAIIVTEFMKNNAYVFPNSESYELFKQLRNNVKKDRKNSVIVYDKGGDIRRLSNVKRDDFNEQNQSDFIIDDRSHIIPLSYKLKGLGLPLFKIYVPYMSSFRKNAPFMIFKKYREIPLKPVKQDYENNGRSKYSKEIEKETNEADNYESYNFCIIHSKYFQKVRRFIFSFKYIERDGTVDQFKIIMFLNNSKPYADFNYKNTRFRVIGPAVPSGYIANYNPHLRLLVIDDDKPSLCDDLVNKKPGFEISKIIKRRNSDSSTSEDSENSVSPSDTVVIGSTTYVNPYPNPQSTLMKDSPFLNTGTTPKQSYVSDKLPPFGAFKDSILYLREPSNILPKKYSEAGRIEVYQDNSILSESLASTFSYDIDTLVLTCIFSTLREVSIRNSNKATSNNIGVVGRFGAFPIQGPNISAFGLASGL
ncbi:uncharacterized protein RJT21DRAFT_116683 [Scheffersomyces amazonensis]|uniref:uncharacterized protein n=1 Tax=Scheffersomyces amazonensis TaxID=1078765 RepID=UPI00315D0AA6